ncbi:MAG: FAD-binding oxidoreductase [Candidatus Nomurabacteria bacterium]|jgi:FAD/FMN-containing dehydrogenase|nr:FAD-binding oxidoreductase [Candidatus Nomurabacteria bacterium]
MSSRLAQYLNKYLVGSAYSEADVLAEFSRDQSVLEMTPEVVVCPENVLDICKTVMLANQLALKGHHIGVTARGSGNDKTGAAIGEGILLDMRSKMNRIIDVDPRQRLIHVQAGVTLGELNKALFTHGLCLPLTLTGVESPELNDQNHTIGGLIANNLGGQAPFRLGRLSDYLMQVEAVLADGSILHTKSQHVRKMPSAESSATFAEKIGANLLAFANENKAELDNLAKERAGNAGYAPFLARTIAENGRFNLLPLFLGSQGTLGIVTEAILYADYLGPVPDLVAVRFESVKQLTSLADYILSEEPSIFNIFDARIFGEAKDLGKIFDKLTDVERGTVVALIGFDDMSARVRGRKVGRLAKLLAQNEIAFATSENDNFTQSWFNNFVDLSVNSENKTTLCDGVLVPTTALEKYWNGLKRLERLLDNEMPVFGSLLTNLYSVRPKFDLERPDKQPVFRFVREYSHFVNSCGGHLAGEAGEGRLLSLSSTNLYNDFGREVNQFVKRQFDPNNILNPNVKQLNNIDEISQNLCEENDFGLVKI